MKVLTSDQMGLVGAAKVDSLHHFVNSAAELWPLCR